MLEVTDLGLEVSDLTLQRVLIAAEPVHSQLEGRGPVAQSSVGVDGVADEQSEKQ
jgi:hypothetical protein